MVQLSKLLAGRERYCGALGEDLQSALGTYEAIASVVQCSEKEMSAGLIFYLKSDALRYYVESIKGIHTWEQVSKMMHDKFTSDEQRARCLTEWQSMSLSTYLRDADSSKSQLAAFTDLSRNLRRLQRQLHADYQPDRFLRDQLVKSADIPEIARSMKEKPPETSHAAEERIAALLSAQPGTAS
jgi:hypothetical protein